MQAILCAQLIVLMQLFPALCVAHNAVNTGADRPSLDRAKWATTLPFPFEIAAMLTAVRADHANEFLERAFGKNTRTCTFTREQSTLRFSIPRDKEQKDAMSQLLVSLRYGARRFGEALGVPNLEDTNLKDDAGRAASFCYATLRQMMGPMDEAANATILAWFESARCHIRKV
jgi:hypothetical protein